MEHGPVNKRDLLSSISWAVNIPSQPSGHSCIHDQFPGVLRNAQVVRTKLTMASRPFPRIITLSGLSSRSSILFCALASLENHPRSSNLQQNVPWQYRDLLRSSIAAYERRANCLMRRSPCHLCQIDVRISEERFSIPSPSPRLPSSSRLALSTLLATYERPVLRKVSKSFACRFRSL